MEGQDLGHQEIGDVELQQHGGAADDLHDGDAQPVQGFEAGRAPQVEQKAQHRAADHGDGAQQQGVTHALQQEDLPVLRHDFDDVAEEIQIHDLRRSDLRGRYTTPADREGPSGSGNQAYSAGALPSSS